MADAFTCASCNQTFEKQRTDEEAMADAEQFFTKDELGDEPEVICGSCWDAQRELTGLRPMPEGLDPELWNIVMRNLGAMLADEIMYGPRQH